MWFAHVTVANVVCKNDTFLMVKERDNGKLVINQPAGHLENNETLLDAVIRETLEETQWHIRPLYALGVSQYRAANGDTYIRHSFVSEALFFDETQSLDSDIEEVCWMSKQDILKARDFLRSPMVLNDIQRYHNGAHFDLDQLYFHDN